MTTEAIDFRYELLERLRSARRDFHERVTREIETRERVLAPVRVLQTLREYIGRSVVSDPRQRCSELFVLTVFLYGALDLQFAGQGIDIEADVQLERLQQNFRYGGADVDARLAPKDWHARMQHQITRLEQQLVVEELYTARLVKLTALTQAALEAASRQQRSP